MPDNKQDELHTASLRAIFALFQALKNKGLISSDDYKKTLQIAIESGNPEHGVQEEWLQMLHDLL